MLNEKQLEEMINFPITGNEACNQLIAVRLGLILEELRKQNGTAPTEVKEVEEVKEEKPKKRTTRKKKTEVKTEEAGE